MGHGYDHHSIQHHHIFHRKNMFLPIFCRLSIKDINLNNRRRKDPTPAADEPSSPKVSCMGQVKRNNRVIGFPTTAAVAAHHHKYSKLRKLFSSKALLPPISTSSQSNTNTSGAAVALSAAAGGRSGSKSCRSSRDQVCLNNLRRLKLNSSGDGKCGQGFVKLVNIGELDPPLPVVKKVAPPGVDRDEVNLWKRRFSGAALKSLQIEPIHLPNTKSQLLI
ncbi:hypothetical protein ACP275_14G329200 [Erythranthe tilingii]